MVFTFGRLKVTMPTLSLLSTRTLSNLAFDDDDDNAANLSPPTQEDLWHALDSGPFARSIIIAPTEKSIAPCRFLPEVRRSPPYLREQHNDMSITKFTQAVCYDRHSAARDTLRTERAETCASLVAEIAS